MVNVLRIFRLFVLIVTSAFFLIVGTLAMTMPFCSKSHKLKIRANRTMYWARLCCRIMGLKTTVTRSAHDNSPYFIVSNHCSYLDILIIGSIMPSVFVAKKEIDSWFFIGLLARTAGTVFIDRSSKAASMDVINVIKDKLTAGVNVAVFPEGATNDGNTIKNFKSALFKAPAEQGIHVLPVTIRYSSINGARLDNMNKDVVIWFGDTSFLSHFWNFLGLRTIDVAAHIGTPIFSQTKGRKHLSSMSHEAVRDAFHNKPLL